MRAFVFFLLTSVVYAAPQGGYNYQIQFDSNVRNELTQEQYHVLQQYAQEQLNQQSIQPPQLPQVLQTPELSSVPQAVQQPNVHGSGSYQFANQLAQQAHQLVNYEQQEQQKKQEHSAQPESVAHNVEPAPVVDVVKQPPAEPQRQEEPKPQPQPISQPRYQPTPQRHQAVQYNKEFFYLSAPQEDFEQPQDIDNQLDNLRKNIRVLFIRAPEQNGLANAALQLAKQSLDQQTVVYVLTKQHDSADLANKLQQIRTSSHSKPDVIFVKYKTPEEAEHAQRTIQSQYEALDGPNHFNHQGVVSTHNFVGSTDHHIDPRRRISSSAKAEIPSSNYLPAADKS